MAMSTAQTKVAPGHAARRIWRALAYLYILFAVVSTLMYARTAFLAPSTYAGVASASLGGALVRTTQNGRIDVVVHHLTAGSALANAGVREADRLRLDIPWNDFRVLRTGEPFGFTRVAPGPAKHMQLIAPQFKGPSTNVVNYRFLTTLFDIGVGLLLFFRCRGDFGVEALGMAFVTAAITSNFPASPYWSIFWILLAYSGAAAAPFLTLSFAMSFFEKHIRPIRPAEKAVFWLLVCGMTIGFVIAFFSYYLAYMSPVIRLNSYFLFFAEIFAYAATMYYFIRGYMLSTGDTRKRYAFLFIALMLTFCLTLVQIFSLLILKQARLSPENPLYDVNVVLSLLGPLIFAYTVLRHRVVDLGFILNRTLIYGAVSIILLVAFGLIDWAVDHFIKPAGRNESAILDAAIAVGVYLTFHRARDFVERHMEAVFFRRWHDNERQLRRLVDEASFITRADNLKSALVRELARFTGGAAVGVYLEGGEAGYRLVEPAQSLPATLDTDEPALVAMRAHRGRIDPTQTASTLPAILALPMLHRNELLGFVLLGPKPGGDGYRPDEVEVLGYATHQIGLDLHALKVEQLERDGARLSQTVHRLEYENALFRRGGAGSRTAKAGKT